CPSIIGQGTPSLLCDLTSGLIEGLSGRGRCEKERDVSPIFWSLCAVDASHGHYFVIDLRIFVACEPWWRPEEKVTSTGNAERSYILPFKCSSDRDSIHNWTARCGLPFSRNRRPGYFELWWR